MSFSSKFLIISIKKRGKRSSTSNCKRDKFVLERVVGEDRRGFKGFGRNVCEKERGLKVTPFNRGGSRGNQGIYRFPIKHERAMDVVYMSKIVRPIWHSKDKSSMLTFNVSHNFPLPIVLYDFSDLHHLVYT